MTWSRSTKQVKVYDDEAIHRLKSFTSFGEQKVAEKTQQFILNANLPLSDERDVQTTVNGASITKDIAEYLVRASSTTSSRAILRSRQRGNYISGNVNEAGLGIRIPSQPTGDAYVRWGYFLGDEGDDLTGIFFQYDADGVSVGVANDGEIVEQIYQQNWNLNRLGGGLDGELNLARGGVSQINFVYYGYGPIKWEIQAPQFDTQNDVIPVHQLKIDDSITINEPNLPISIEVSSGTSGSQLDAYVGGRQFSTYGKQEPNERIVGAYRRLQSVGQTFVPLISFREKTGYKNILTSLNSVSILSDQDLIWEMRFNGTLTGASFAKPNNYVANECATEWDISATAITGGAARKSDLSAGDNRNQLTSAVLPERKVGEDDVVTLCARTAANTGTATVTSHLEVAELW